MNDTTTDIIANPFDNAEISAAPSQAPSTLREQTSALAEVKISMTLARQFPRNRRAAMENIINACARPSLAEDAIYSFARGGTSIEGPSIRLMEAIAQEWGNISFGLRELARDKDGSHAMAFAWDLETNTRREMTFYVPHKRHTRRGSYRLEDPRDIYEMFANLGQRRVRSCLQAVIPGDVVETARIACNETLKAGDHTSPESVAKLVDAFAGIGVKREQIEKRIQRRIDAILPAQIINLRKVFMSIRDGMSTPADWFEVETKAPTGKGAEAAKRAVKSRTKAKKTEPKAEEDDFPHEPPTGSMTDEEKAAQETADAAEYKTAQGKLI